MNPTLHSIDPHSTQRPIPNPPDAFPLIGGNRRAPVSFTQQRFWFLDQLEPHNPVYNLSEVWRLKGNLNVPAFQQSLSEIVRRHEILRTTFGIVEDQIVQNIAAPSPIEIPLVDLRDSIQESDRVQQIIVEETRKPFDLQKGPLFRGCLFRLKEREHIVLFGLHHSIFDAWSRTIFLKELGLLYEAISRGQAPLLPKLPAQYADFASWQRNWLQGELLEKQLSYWKECLKGTLPLIELPYDHPRPAVPTFRGAIQKSFLPKSLMDRIKAMSHSEGVTEFMVLLTAFQVLISRYSGREDILVGSPIANRNREEFESLIGCFLNTLVLRTDLSGDPSFRELLKRVRTMAFEAYAHQELPFEKLVEELQPMRNPSYHPVFQVMFTFQNAPVSAMQLTDLEMEPMAIDMGTSKFDLLFNVIQFSSKEASVEVEYARDLFEPATIARMLEHYRILLEGALSRPEERLSALPLISGEERHQLLFDWNQTQVDFPESKCLHTLFEEQAEKTPEAVAIYHGERSLNYRELNQRANALASRLVKMGVRSEVPVGICMERSPEMVIALFAVLKAGGAYVPLDPSYPADRLAFAVEDTQMPILLTQEKWLKDLPSRGARLIALETLGVERDESVAEGKGNPDRPSQPENLAYIIYTSGSTGRPKGVAIEHRSSVTLVHWAQRVFNAEELAGVLASTSICFDLSVFELFVPLSCGGSVILADNVLELLKMPEARRVSLINTVPSAMAELIRLGGVPLSVRTVNLAGEALPNALVRQIYQLPHIQKVYDLYGPSEDTTYSTFVLRTPTGPETIGRPIANTQAYILDRYRQLAPIGVPGELYLGGEGLARGYLNRPDLTAEKFIPNPCNPAQSARLYRTGDLVRYRPDGNIQFLGRLDHQVKVRGFRIELAEIESVLKQNPQVQDCAVLAHGNELGEKKLVAYIVPAATEELRQWLKGKLPSYMLPSTWIPIPSLPRTPNGKIDRKALPPPDLQHGELEPNFIPPNTSVEKALAQIWCDVLRLKQVGLEDNFFDVGGHSLLVTRIVSRVNEAFQVTLTLRDVFEVPTLRAMASLVEKILTEEIKGMSEEEALNLAQNLP